MSCQRAVVTQVRSGPLVDGLMGRGNLVGLQDGSWTTRELRELEQQTASWLRIAAMRSRRR